MEVPGLNREQMTCHKKAKSQSLVTEYMLSSGLNSRTGCGGTGPVIPSLRRLFQIWRPGNSTLRFVSFLGNGSPCLRSHWCHHGKFLGAARRQMKTGTTVPCVCYVRDISCIRSDLSILLSHLTDYSHTELGLQHKDSPWRPQLQSSHHARLHGISW